MSTTAANALGLLALACWSMNVAVTRHLGESHHFGLPGISFAGSGLLLLLLDWVRGRPNPWKNGAGWHFWVLCGGAFVAYVLLYVSGLAWSSSRALVLPLGLVNYFWPSLILVLMPWFTPRRLRPLVLAMGIVLCLMGVASALLWGVPAADLAQAFRSDWPAFVMMAVAAFLWAFYSNAVRKWGGAVNGVGWFLLAGGICFLVLWAATGDGLGFEAGAVLPLCLHMLVVNAAAYMFWDAGVRRGDIGLMGIAANFLPVASVAFGSWYLGDPASPGLWLGGGLVTAGAVLCRRGIREDPSR